MNQIAIATDKLFFRLGEVCEITGVQPHVLRYWETEFPMLAPQKNRAGQRTYRRRDVELALRIKELLYDEQYTISGAKKRLENESREVVNAELSKESEARLVHDRYPTHLGDNMEVVLVSDTLTPTYLLTVVTPFLKAISDIQVTINEIQGRNIQAPVIKSIRQNSPLSINLVGAAEAIQQIQNTIVPWRRRHGEKMALLLEKEKQAQIGNSKAEILEKRSRSIKDRAKAERIAVDAARQREETERIRLENEKLRIELQRSKIQLALDVIAQISPNLSEEERVAYVVKLLPPLEAIVSSELEMVIDRQDLA